MEDIIAIKDFMEYCKVTDGNSLEVIIAVSKKNTTIYQGTANVYFMYDVGYMQYRITIDWSFDDSKMHGLGLHGSYNTNFQDFSYANGLLTIRDGSVIINISKG